MIRLHGLRVLCASSAPISSEPPPEMLRCPYQTTAAAPRTHTHAHSVVLGAQVHNVLGPLRTSISRVILRREAKSSVTKRVHTRSMCFVRFVAAAPTNTHVNHDATAQNPTTVVIDIYKHTQTQSHAYTQPRHARTHKRTRAHIRACRTARTRTMRMR